MPDCATCQFFDVSLNTEDGIHTNRPGGMKLTRQALELIHLPPGAHILDVACGTGATLDYLERQLNYHAVGLDSSGGMLSLAQRSTRGLAIIRADGVSIPLTARSQDAVMLECAFHLAGDSSSVMKEIRRVLKPQGMLIISDIYLREVKDSSILDVLSHSQCLSNLLTFQEIQSYMIEAGFEIFSWQDQAPVFKEWMMGKVFELGSLQKFYRRLLGEKACGYGNVDEMQAKVRLGYYLMVAQKNVAETGFGDYDNGGIDG